jgi:hypothetical protein
MKNKILWDNILGFDLDGIISGYSFSTRLAHENCWTKGFTEKAILEYKKFMYLAATSDMMVSPSHIVDIVWHQHLIFTHSYEEFCNLLGKKIHHVPSSRRKDDLKTFSQATERTHKLYFEVFGNIPSDIWNSLDMWESLELRKPKINSVALIALSITIFFSLNYVSYFFLKPIYVKIDNPFFLIGFIAFVVITFLFLEDFNRNFLAKVIKSFKENSFIYHLSPLELIFLKTHKLSNVVAGIVNDLIKDNKIVVHKDNKIENHENHHPQTIEESQIMEILADLGKTYYPNLVRILIKNPLFYNIVYCISKFKRYFRSSKKFQTLFFINICVFMVILTIGLIRATVGAENGKDEHYLLLSVVVLIIVMVFYLRRLRNFLFTFTIPKLYKDEILVQRKLTNDREWQYFLFGQSMLDASFIPLVDYINQHNHSNHDTTSSCGSECGSSCGSGCGSSCGGGCGGCGGG